MAFENQNIAKEGQGGVRNYVSSANLRIVNVGATRGISNTFELLMCR